MSSSRNALHVLRLIWMEQAPSMAARPLSTVALARDIDTATSSTTPSRAVSPLTTTQLHFSQSQSPHDSASTFLEPESPEYTTASLTLPPRHFHADPIPWPTIFPHSQTHRKKQKFCDPLYRLVTTRQYDDALRIYEELRSHGIHIQHRHVYLDAAVSALRRGKQGVFLRWLELYPNRPATSNHPGLKSIWSPIIEQVLHQSQEQPELLSLFLETTAKKGLLPTILPPLLPHLAFTVPPQLSRQTVDRIITSYRTATTSSESTSARATVQQEFVAAQVNKWWSTYLRQLIVAGWNDDARALYESPPSGVEWDHFTDKVARETLDSRSESGHERDGVVDSDPTSLASHIRAALHDLPTPNRLAALTGVLSHSEVRRQYPSLFSRFKSRFTRPPTTLPDRTTPTIQERLWLHAEIINLQREGQHEQALRLFQQNFVWSGLPRPPQSKVLVDDSNSCTKKQRCYPTVQIMTTIIPSVLHMLPEPSDETLVAYHHLYLNSIPKYLPSLRPTSTTHAVFLRHIAKFAGPAAGIGALKVLQEGGHDLDEACYAAVLYSLGGRRRTHQMYQLLDEMEEERGVGVGKRTYKGLVAILVKTGLGDDAGKVFWRAREKLGADDVLDGLLVE
ncbi:hypothetical protein IAR55_004153 [Kwoniella newhampshirensis]|uniref:Pentatricopeptide repeat domain-containing protein n=1 Tax=Kwoniella newhampshirensis TaxID=1651941 RepID=A0AAW0YYW6_9TREE